MDDFFVTLRVPAEDLRDAEKQAEGIGDAMELMIESVYPSFDTDTDNYGQVIVYTGHYVDQSQNKCEGHPAGPHDPMGETVFCDGSCISSENHPTKEEIDNYKRDTE